MGVFKTPKAPDPGAVASAQAGANQDGAVASQLVNAIDQVTPDGNLSYAQNGEWSFTDSTGARRTIPRLTATQTLNATQQQAKNYEQQADLGTNRLATTLLGNAQGALGQPADFSEANIKAKTDSMINPRIEDRFNRDRAALETSLINRGIRQGSQQYTDALGDFERSRNDAFTQEGLANRQQAIQELGMSRDRSINEIGALLGTGQIQTPQFTATPRAQIDAAPIGQYMMQNYQNRVSNANARMGGLFGLAGQVVGAAGRAAGAAG